MMKLNDRKWRAFNVTDIFDHIQRGKGLKMLTIFQEIGHMFLQAH